MFLRKKSEKTPEIAGESRSHGYVSRDGIMTAENVWEGIIRYSICFLLVSVVVFCWFWASKRTFIWNADGWDQQYKTLVYWGRYLRSLVKSLLIDHSFSIPEWDFAIGEGSDILTTFQCHVVGDPLCLLAVFVPTKYMWVLFGLLNCIRMYLSGAFFIVLCFRTGQRSRYGVLAGSLSYAFCGWALMQATRQQIYLMPLMYLPLLILGVEELIRKKRARILVVSVFLAAISNFYFFYVLACLTVVYVVVRLYLLYKNDFRGAVKMFLCIAGASLIGVVLSAAIVLPVIRTYFGSSRMSIHNGVRLFYSWSHYSMLPGMLVSNLTSKTLRMGYSITVIPALLLLFRKKGQHKILKIFSAICLAIVVFPFLGQALHGFSYITNRWCFALALLVSYILTVMWDELMTLSRRDTGFLLICGSGYFLLCLLLDHSRTEETMASMALLFLLLCMLIYTRDSEENPVCAVGQTKWYAIVCHRQAITVGITVISICMRSFWLYSSVTAGESAESRYLIREVGTLQQTEAQVVKRIGDDEMAGEPYRYSGRNITTNANFLAGVSSTDYYWSIANPYAVQFRAILDAGENSAFHYTNYDDCAALTSLARVRYYAVRTEDRQPVPYGFSYINSFDVREDSTVAAMEAMQKELGAEELSDSHKKSISDETALYFSIYRNDYALPLAYTYDDTISTDTWNRLNRVEKQEALLQSVVIDQSGDSVEGKVSLTGISPDYTITCNDDRVTQSGNAFVVTAPGASVTLSFDGMENSETYVLVDGLQYDSTSEYELYFGNREVDPLELYNKTGWNLLSHERQREIIRGHEDSVYMKMPVKSSDGAVKTLEYTTPYYIMYCGRHDFTTNLGYAEEPLTDITISFPNIGIYSYDSIEVICQPMDRYSERIEALKSCTLENMKMKNDTITGTIHADRDKWLCLAIPYSAGWRAYVDGSEAELYQANIQYMAVRIPTGDHTVRMVYETPLLRTGVCISAVSFVFVIVGSVILKRKKDRGSKAATEA